MKNKKDKVKPILSDKISADLTVAPRPDIEDDVIFQTKPRITTRDQISSSEDELEIKHFKQRNFQLLSDLNDKYKGEIVSKQDLDSLTSNSEDSEDETKENSLESESEHKSDNENAPTSNSDVLCKKTDSEDEESDNYDITHSRESNSDEEESGSNESDEEPDDEDGYDISQMEEPPKETFEHMTKHNVSEEVKKGQCVRNQLLIWEGLLEMRIHMQRCVNTANQLPAPDVHRELRRSGGDEFVVLTDKTRDNVGRVLDKLITLQNLLLKNFSETKNLSQKSKLSNHENSTHSKKSDSDEEIPSDDEEIPSDDEEIPSDNDNESAETKQKSQDIADTQPPAKKRKLSDYEKEISQSHRAFTLYRNATIQKWNDKTRLITATAHKNSSTNSVLSQIDYILSDRDKLIRRTQLKRSEYDIVGYKKPVKVSDENNEVEIYQTVKDRKDDDEYIPEIFDDSDFYHQMLRELIECKSADISDPIQLSRQWITLQQMRSKMKRKVDTKATKGRRIKYVVHNKLINFMAPDDTSTWTDESRNELYSSLFGKMFEANADNFVQNGFKLTTENGV